jgi:hypothetical protein
MQFDQFVRAQCTVNLQNQLTRNTFFADLRQNVQRIGF